MAIDTCKKCGYDLHRIETLVEHDPEGLRAAYWCEECKILFGTSKGSRFPVYELASYVDAAAYEIARTRDENRRLRQAIDVALRFPEAGIDILRVVKTWEEE